MSAALTAAAFSMSLFMSTDSIILVGRHNKRGLAVGHLSGWLVIVRQITRVNGALKNTSTALRHMCVHTTHIQAHKPTRSHYLLLDGRTGVIVTWQDASFCSIHLIAILSQCFILLKILVLPMIPTSLRPHINDIIAKASHGAKLILLHFSPPI